MTNEQPQKKTIKWWHALIAVMTLGGIVSAFQSTTNQPVNQNKEPTASQERGALALTAIKIVKKDAKDPGSVIFTSLRVDEAGDTVCAEFRAKNSFGALVPSIYIGSIKRKIESTHEKDWNKYCTGSMYDMSRLYR